MRRVPVGAVVLAGAMVFMFVLTNLAGWFGDGTPREKAAADPAKPFVGTPARDWADGAAGIVVPTVEAIGSHSVDAVTDAYARARDVVAAAMLEPAVIMGVDYEPYLRLFADGDQESLRAALADPERVDRFVVRLGPDTTLLPVPPKVRGRMWAESGGTGKLLVKTRFVVVYPLHTEDGPQVRVARLDMDLSVVGDGRPEADHGVWLNETQGYPAECDNPSALTRGGGLPDALFDPDRPIESGSPCPN
jgi:hypothetical protein